VRIKRLEILLNRNTDFAELFDEFFGEFLGAERKFFGKLKKLNHLK